MLFFFSHSGYKAYLCVRISENTVLNQEKEYEKSFCLCFFDGRSFEHADCM